MNPPVRNLNTPSAVLNDAHDLVMAWHYADSGFLETQSFDADIQSPNDMLIDPDEYVIEAPEEKDNVTIINPDQLDNDGDLRNTLRADDCMLACTYLEFNDNMLMALADEAMKEHVLLPLEAQPPIIAEAVHTWHIEKWRNLAKKEHGPIFDAGGYPW